MRFPGILVLAMTTAACTGGEGRDPGPTDDGVDDVVEIKVEPHRIVVDPMTSVAFRSIGITESGHPQRLDDITWSFEEIDVGDEFAASGGFGTITPDGVYTPGGTPTISYTKDVAATSESLGIVGRTSVRVIPPGRLSVSITPFGGQDGNPDYFANVEVLSPASNLSMTTGQFGHVVVTGDFSGPMDLRVTAYNRSMDLFGVLDKEFSVEIVAQP